MSTLKSLKSRRLFRIRIATRSAEATRKLGKTFGLELRKEIAQLKHAIIICLEGELGSGKTTFIQGMARGLAIKDRIVSPTFLLMRTYGISKSKKHGKLLHIDAYRITNKKDASILENKNFFEDPSHIVVVEWPEKIPHLLRKRTITIRLSHGTKENERSVIIEARA